MRSSASSTSINKPLWYLRQCVVRGARVGLVPAAFFTGPNAVRGGGGGGGIGFGTAGRESGRDGTESLSPQMAEVEFIFII